jgi:hypothetical protein
MSAKQEQQGNITIPPAPSTNHGDQKGWRPDQIDPDLANIAMAEMLLSKFGTPSNITPAFNIRKAMFTALNHKPGTKKGDPGWTGIDCSLRLAVYNNYELGTVNELGLLFNNIWSYLMKPRFILSGFTGQPQEKPEEEGFGTRVVNGIFGKPKNAADKPK